MNDLKTLTPQVCPKISTAACLLLLFCLVPMHVQAQTGDAALHGEVSDASGAVVPKATVTLLSPDTGTKRTTQSNSSGDFTFEALPPGTYTLRAEHSGFAVTQTGVMTLHTADSLAIAVKLKVGSVNETVSVSGAGLTTDNPAVSLTVSREFVENMPLNGRSFQDLIQLAPGTVSDQKGYYSINGQRSDSNNYTVDGVSANAGGLNNNAGQTLGAGISGSAPLQTVMGTTQSLASIDALQEFTIQTSGYSAEFGRNPGGQVQFTTRSGTNQFHGSAFDYLRNTVFDANSFSNDYKGDPKTAEHQNDFGGTLGGPVTVPKLYNGKDNTFFFASYEGLRLLLPSSETEYNPTQAFRNAVSPNIQPFLNAVPLPNTSIAGDSCTVSGTTINISGNAGPGASPCDEQFYRGYSYPNNLDSYSLRVDENLGRRFHAFVRYADTPSSELTGLETFQTTATSTHTWTAGLTANISSSLLDDLRFTYLHDGEESVTNLRSIDESTPWSRTLLIPAAYDSPLAYGYAYIDLPSTDLSVRSDVSGSGTALHQYQIADSLNWTRGRHSLKFGLDWRRLETTALTLPYESLMDIETLAGLQQGYATSLGIYAQAPGQPVFHNLSFYAQDQWKIVRRLSVDYGLRWEFNPPPGPSNGHYPVTLTSTNLADATLTDDNTQPYKTNYHSFAPRFGFAWNAIPTQRHAVTVRGGFGIFFDTGQQVIGSGYYDTYPFQASGPTQTDVPLPFSQAELAPPSLNFSLTPPYPSTDAASPDLTLPYTEQWSLSIDEMLNAKNTLTASYVGNNGRKLLFTGRYDPVPGNPDFTLLSYTYNGAQSSYNALQVQDVGKLTNGLDFVGSFTWSHALDNDSIDNGIFAPQYGNSNFDLRRVLNLALNYQMPIAGWNHWTQSITHGWLLANRFSAQSGYPLSLYQAEVDLPDGTEEYYYPNLVPGIPIYLHGRAADVNGMPVPANWRLNSAAFACVPTNTGKECSGTPLYGGDLGRNFIRNPSFWTWNTAFQRTFPIYEQMHINFRVDAFNILNHPNLTGPNTSFTSSTFGQLIDSTTSIGSSNALYAMGAPRSLQLSLHLQF